MTIEEIVKRGFKNEASYKKDSTEFSYRLKDEGDQVCMEEKVLSSYKRVVSWLKQGKYPIGINNIPYQRMMVIKYSDGSVSTFDTTLKFVEIVKGTQDREEMIDLKIKKGGKCPQCGTLATGKFCPVCGTPIPCETVIGHKQCPQCGALVTGKFCSECGTPIN